VTVSTDDLTAALVDAADDTASTLGAAQRRYEHAHSLTTAVRAYDDATPTEELRACDALDDALTAFGDAFDCWRVAQTALLAARRADAGARRG
jgi:hypothetical protein